MDQSLIVRGAPQEYECRIGAWDELPSHLERRNISTVLVLHGNTSWEVAKQFFPTFHSIHVHFEFYRGDCTEENRNYFKEMIETHKIEAIVAVGGGKVSDLAKFTAISCGIPVIILPTLASTCAAYTPLSVIYKPDGEMLRYEVFPVSNALVLIEPRAILDSPVELMVAGIGDTLAKWYEADAIITQLEAPSVEIEVAHFAAKCCKEYLLRYSTEAIQAMKNQVVNEAFLKVVETNILLGGMVGGFGDDFGRCAGAHSIHDALTILPESHQLLHGNKVAYGILVQLVLENRWKEIEKLLPFYHELQLPCSLKEMNLDHLDESTLLRIAERATEPHETIHYMQGTITAEKVLQAIKDLETFMQTYQK